ncbi:hypothetical protein [Hymenobacter sp.]|uniref:hypothetical protein n=1 Tax=Hymenobacter sp. TaxID=1898978 RepID=UPI002EDBB356
MIPDVDRTNNFVFLGLLVSQKGVAMAIQAFHKVLTTLTNAREHIEKPSLTIIGVFSMILIWRLNLGGQRLRTYLLISPKW